MYKHSEKESRRVHALAGEEVIQHDRGDGLADGYLEKDFLDVLSICMTMEPFRLQVIGASAFAS